MHQYRDMSIVIVLPEGQPALFDVAFLNMLGTQYPGAKVRVVFIKPEQDKNEYSEVLKVVDRKEVLLLMPVVTSDESFEGFRVRIAMAGLPRIFVAKEGEKYVGKYTGI